MVKINGYAVIDESPKVVLGAILSIPKDLEIWSLDALQKFYILSHELVCDLCEERKLDKKKYTKCAQFSRFLSTSRTRIKFLPRDREQILTRIYNEILQAHQLGHLTGFGFSNKFGDRLRGNPEKQTVVN